MMTVVLVPYMPASEAWTEVDEDSFRPRTGYRLELHRPAF